MDGGEWFDIEGGGGNRGVACDTWGLVQSICLPT